MIRRLLMMSDLGPTSVRAFAPLAALAKSLDDPEVILVHTVESSAGLSFMDPFVIEQMDLLAQEQAIGPLDLQADQLREHGLRVKPLVVFGSPFSIVHEAFQRFRADLVVMPTDGHHSLLRRVSNSATARVIRDQEVPVLVVNGAMADARWTEFGPVVHPMSLNDEDDAGLQTAADLAVITGAELHLVHVLRSPPTEDAYGSDPELSAAIEEGFAMWRDKVEAKLNGLATAMTRVRTKAVVLEHEHCGDGVIAYLNEVNAGSVVMPSLAHDSVHTKLMGSVAEHVLLAAPCPVLVFNRPLHARD